MTNFEIFKDVVMRYLSEYDISMPSDSTLHEVSLNNDGIECKIQ